MSGLVAASADTQKCVDMTSAFGMDIAFAGAVYSQLSVPNRPGGNLEANRTFMKSTHS